MAATQQNPWIKDSRGKYYNPYTGQEQDADPGAGNVLSGSKTTAPGDSPNTPPAPLDPGQLPKPVGGPKGGPGGDVHTTKPDPSSDDPLDPVNAAPGGQAAMALKQWQRDLPGYLQNQIGGAEDNARLGLAKSIQDTKASANSRGLLYSGIEGGGEAMDKAEAGGKLAGDIQNINVGAEDITSQKYSLAQQEANSEDANILAQQQQQVDQSQQAYELAMQEQQNSSSWYKDLFSGIGTVTGAIAGAVVGGPGGAVAGANVGGKLGGMA